LAVDLVVGARPNLVKLAPVLAALLRRRDRVRPRVIHTGQHFDPVMAAPLGGATSACEIVGLCVASPERPAGRLDILAAYERLLRRQRRPQGIVVFGDVHSTVAAAFAAGSAGIRLAHVEAGLRSFDPSMPEEHNRCATDALADLLFVTEQAARENLLREGCVDAAIQSVGNVMIDTLVGELEAARALRMPDALGLARGAYAYATLHRPANVDAPARLAAFVAALCAASASIPLVFPLHPRTRARLAAGGLLSRLQAEPNVRVLDPQPYRNNLSLLCDARLVLTDSGGVQDESAYLGIPCLTLRRNTERPVTLEGGLNRLVPSAPEGLVETIEHRLGEPAPPRRSIPGWDGHAAERVAQVLVREWC
jgi:UDP-N-acetylglucosamine 2-epimerase (non-hydrolysing)